MENGMMMYMIWGVPLYLWLIVLLTKLIYLVMLFIWPIIFDDYVWPPEGVKELFGEEFAEQHTRDDLKWRLRTAPAKSESSGRG